MRDVRSGRWCGRLVNFQGRLVIKQEIMRLRHGRSDLFVRRSHGRPVTPEARLRLVIEFLEDRIRCVSDDGVRGTC
jgi:hypothetical protein